MKIDKIDSNIAAAKTIDKMVYISTEFLLHCKEKIFLKTWHFVGYKNEFVNNINAIPKTILEGFLNEPILLSKDTNDTIFCLSNVCNHRGNILTQTPCYQKNIRCKYHGRLFQLNGKFISMPEFKNVLNFIPENNHLLNFPLFNWGNLLFTNLMYDKPASLYFTDMMERMHWYDMEKLKMDTSNIQSFVVKANWALYCENYLEGFHIPFVHPGLNSFIDFSNYKTEVFPYSNLQLGFGKYKKDCFDLPTNCKDYGKNVAAYYFWVFPNMMFNFYPWGLSVNIVQPLTATTTCVQFIPFILDESKLEKGAGSNLNSVEKEDEEIVENVQKGVQSIFYKHGRYSPEREQGTHHFHTLLTEFI